MIKISNGIKIYNRSEENEYVALSEINCELPECGFVVISGKSGSGKTTLLNIISGFDSLTSGNLETSYDKNYASFVFQDFQLIDNLSLYENLKLISEITNNCTLKDIDKIIEDFSLSKFKNHYPNQLSGGQKQRTAIMRSILLDRPVLICDEPTGNLDETTSMEIMEILYQISRNKLVIVVTHDYELFSKYCDKLITLKDGKIIEDNNFFTIPFEKEIKKNEVRFGNKLAILFSFKNIKKSKMRYIFLCISLFLSVLLTITSLNIIMNEDDINRKKSYQNNNIDYVDTIYSSQDYNYSIHSKDRDTLVKKYKDAIEYVDCEYRLSDISISRIYFSNQPMYELINSNIKSIGINEVVITEQIAFDYIKANNIDSMDKLIDKKVKFENIELTIKGITKTGYREDVGSLTFPRMEYYNVLLMNYETFYNAFYDKTTVLDAKYNGSTHSIDPTISNSIEDGHISISRSLAERFTNEPSNLIGKKITLELRNEFYESHNHLDDSIRFDKIEFIVSNIFDDGEGIKSYLSEKDYNFIFEKYALRFNPSNDFGVSVKDVSSNFFNEIRKMGLSFNTAIENEINYARDYYETIAYIQIAIALVILILSLIILVNYVSTSISKSKREIGVLASFGIKMKSILKIFIYDILFIIIMAVVISSLLEIFIIDLQNVFLINKGVVSLNYLYYDFSPIFVVLSCLILISLIYLLGVYLILKKKSIVDIVYER